MKIFANMIVKKKLSIQTPMIIIMDSKQNLNIQIITMKKSNLINMALCSVNFIFILIYY